MYPDCTAELVPRVSIISPSVVSPVTAAVVVTVITEPIAKEDLFSVSSPMFVSRVAF